MSVFCINQKIKSSLYSPYYAEACNEWRGPSPRLSAWATQLRRNVATVASRWRHCADLTGPGIEPLTSRTDSVRLAFELIGWSFCINHCLKSVSFCSGKLCLTWRNFKFLLLFFSCKLCLILLKNF